MRQPLLWMIPLVLLAACDDATPVQPRTDTRGVQASVADARRLMECQQPSMIPLGTDQRMSGPHSLATVTVIESGGQSLVFQTPTSIAFAPGGGPAAHCQMWGRTAGGRGIVYVAPDTVLDTLVFVPTPPKTIENPHKIKPGQRTFALIWLRVREHKARCFGCPSDTLLFQRLDGHTVLDTLARSLGGIGPRFGWGPAGSDADDLASAFVAACKTSSVLRTTMGISDDRDRRLMDELGQALVADNQMPVAKSTPWMKNWKQGITAGFRSWKPDCVGDLLRTFWGGTLDLSPYLPLGSPAPGGGGGGNWGYEPRDPFAPPGPPPESYPDRAPLTPGTRSPA